MRKIINGKMYNTETAEQVATWTNGHYSDFNFCCETLYRKRTGEYFIHGEGGAASKYAEPVDTNSWASGSSIKPITKDAARKWMETYAEVDEYIAEFGEPEE